MIETAENLVRQYSISRQAADAYAARSQQRAAAAQAAGRFDREVVPIPVTQKNGPPIIFARDEGVRGESTAESLAGLTPIIEGNRDGR